MSTPAVEREEIVIEATRGLRAFAWRDLWAYRDLLWLLVWRDFATRYKQTILGPLWFIVQPVLQTLIFSVVFGGFAKIPTAGVPAQLFYLCGLVPWGYFSQTFQSTSSTLVANAGLFGKVYFPRLIVPLAGALSNLLAFVIQLATFAAFYVFFKFTPQAASFGLQWDALLLPIALLHVAALSFGVGLWLAALTAKFRDFTVLAGFLIQLWMYVTPVIYPLSQVPGRWRTLVALNPMTMPVECFRHALLGAGSPSVALLGLSVGVTVVVLLSGLVIFQQVEKTFVDVI